MQRSNPFGVLFVMLCIFVGVICLGFIGCEANKEYREKQEKIRLAKEHLDECENCPEEGLPDVLHRPDPWGNDLMVKYNDGFRKSVTIICCGPDGKVNTKDDIRVTRHIKLDWKAGGDAVGEAGGEALQGLWRGLKRSFTEEEEKK